MQCRLSVCSNLMGMWERDVWEEAGQSLEGESPAHLSSHSPPHPRPLSPNPHFSPYPSSVMSLLCILGALAGQ